MDKIICTIFFIMMFNVGEWIIINIVGMVGFLIAVNYIDKKERAK